jgi:hypothetical protein
MKRFSLAFGLVACAFPLPSAFASTADCRRELQTILLPNLRALEVDLTKLIKEEPIFAPRAETLKIYLRLSERDPELLRLIPESEFARLLADPERTYAPEMLDQLLRTLDKTSESDALVARLTRALRATLENKVPAKSIDARIQALLAGKKDSLLRALGDMDLEETQELYHGGDFARPSKDSLIGKYLAETGAKTMTKRFPVSPGSSVLGPERLVVAVSEKSFAEYQKYFSLHNNLSVIGHAYVVHNGKLSSYIHKGVDMRLPSVGNTLPTVLLKTSEADRTTQYLRVMTSMQPAGAYVWDSPAMQPWKVPGYCPLPGAYANCTHWIGNMPIGDKTVDTLQFPGAMDDYAAHHVSVDDSAPRLAKLGENKSQDKLLRRIFKTPSNEQFSFVIGQGDANLRGDFSNPGWVIQTLLGPTSNDRVPVIFLVTPDHRAPIDPDFVPHFEEPV